MLDITTLPKGQIFNGHAFHTISQYIYAFNPGNMLIILNSDFDMFLFDKDSPFCVLQKDGWNFEILHIDGNKKIEDL